MKDKRDDARRMAEELIAEETSSGKPRSFLTVYLTALIIGLAVWAAIYYLWLSV